MVLVRVKAPAPFIGDGVLVESFRGSTPRFSDPYSGFTITSEEFGKVDIPKAEPFLQLRSARELDRMP